MDRIQLYNLLQSAGLRVDLVGLADNYYEPVSPAWVQSNWTAWVEARPEQLTTVRELPGGVRRTVPQWAENSSDCDNLALGCMNHGHVGNALKAATSGKARGGLAFGVIFYVAEQRLQGGHAINWFIDHDWRVCFFEPGTGELVELNTTERASAKFALAA